jgi:hypothetical protein
MDTGSVIIHNSYNTYDENASENRTPCTMKLIHNVRMEEPKDRLRAMRMRAGYEKASDAARDIKEINKNTLISHENGNRPISKKSAEVYARVFNVEGGPGWILFGEIPDKANLLKTAREKAIADFNADSGIINKIVRINKKFELMDMAEMGDALSKIDNFLDVTVPESPDPDHKK